MGSRFMHLLVADHVASELGLTASALDVASASLAVPASDQAADADSGPDDYGQMLLGSIAPDARKTRDGHFKATPVRFAHNTPIDYGRFVLKYRDRVREPFLLGYLSHLVMDDVWTMKSDFSGFEARVKADRSLYEVYHQDLWLLNAKLYEYYQPIGLREALRDAVIAPSGATTGSAAQAGSGHHYREDHGDGGDERAGLYGIEEVDAKSLEAYRQQALEDFDYPAENLTKPLNLFTLDEMVHYVERSKRKALDICRMVSALAL